ncbi:TSUP family transporter [Luteimonas sp. MHLX1A]|uniref:TSUP family transporter n=1 Tax=Alterluteimonas muca TaxID=2878684 RepID=UPI001E5EA0CC|nr:TSUP family transporter [Luteimonas sp. MHLX1A]MCD9045225.1 TSUP family transporter [Luteimonas sp. MHLX1A]
MEFGLDVLALLALAAFVAGTIDAMAGGGGLITIPALMAAGVPPVQALATNKLQSSFGTSGAVYAFARRGWIDFRRIAWPAGGAFAGSVGGALALQAVDPSFLAGLVPLLLITMAGYFLFGPKPSETDTRARLGEGALVATMTALGFYDGFFGPGAGSFMATALVALFGMGLVSATAHTKCLNLASNVAALITFVIGGQVLWLLGLVMAVASLAGGQLGAHLALKVGSRAIRPLLVVMSLALTVKLLADADNPLTAWLRTFLV